VLNTDCLGPRRGRNRIIKKNRQEPAAVFKALSRHRGRSTDHRQERREKGRHVRVNRKSTIPMTSSNDAEPRKGAIRVRTLGGPWTEGENDGKIEEGAITKGHILGRDPEREGKCLSS